LTASKLTFHFSHLFDAALFYQLAPTNMDKYITRVEEVYREGMKEVKLCQRGIRESVAVTRWDGAK
jgi:hypothetical protein